MQAATETALREELQDRRRQLAGALATHDQEDLRDLLTRVDLALGRLGAGSIDICEECLGTIEADRLLANPLTRVCLNCLSEAETRALEHDLETAAAIQAALLPPFEIHRGGWELSYAYRPLGPVSGDHFDVIEAEPAGGPLYFLFGDVAGKGVAASLLMTHLHALFRSLVATRLPLADMLCRANRIFSASTLSRSYATLVVAKLEPDGKVEIANLGHCPPLLLRQGAVEVIDSTTLPFGLFPEVEPSVLCLRIGLEDLLVLYTDGLSEARDRRGREYGQDRLAALLPQQRGLPVRDTLRAILDDAAAFRDDSRLTDDLTLAVCRRVG